MIPQILSTLYYMKRNTLTRKKTSIYQFNHISKDLSDEKVRVLRVLYKYYHKKRWCYEELYWNYKRLNLIFAIGGSGAIVSGVVAGGITLNPIILAIVTAVGVVAKTISEIKDYSSKVEKCKYAFTTYEKVLTDIRTYLRGEEYNHHDFILCLKLIDETIIDMCPNMHTKIYKEYDKKFTSEL